MKQKVIYTYQGDKGTISTSIKMNLEPIYSKIRLTAEPKKLLTNGERKERLVEVPVEEVDNWVEIEATEEDYAEGRITNSNYVNYKKLLEIITDEEVV